jgi:hypothetical protein
MRWATSRIPEVAGALEVRRIWGTNGQTVICSNWQPETVNCCRQPLTSK